MRNTAILLLYAQLLLGMAVCADSGMPATIVVDGSTEIGEMFKVFAASFQQANPDVTVFVSESGSGNGAKALINRTCHMAIMSRPMKTREVDAARSANVSPVPHTVAFEALAVVVHPSNGVERLSVTQVRQIYSGAITNWSQLAGSDTAIRRICRDTSSGKFDMFYYCIMCEGDGTNRVGHRIAPEPRVEYCGSDGSVRNYLCKQPGAIGLVGLSYIDSSIRAVPIDGNAPTESAVVSGSYPIVRRLYVYTDGNPQAGTPLAKFLAYVLSPERAEVIRQHGCIPPTLKDESSQPSVGGDSSKAADGLTGAPRR
jgi:phosphate transport system substrate-binding protein